MNKLPLSLLVALAVVALPVAARAADPVQDLAAIYRMAQDSDPLWASARSANLAAQEKRVQGKALTLPTAAFSANANHTQTDLDRTGTGGGFSRSGFDKFETYGYRLDLSHPLYRKQNTIQSEQAETLVAQADEQLNKARLDLMVRVSQAYFDVLLAQDKVDLIAAQKAAITRQLEQAQANFEVGTSTVTDVHEAQARYDLTLAQEIAATNELEVKKRAVQSLTGQPPQRLAAARADLRAALPEPLDMEKWVEIAEQNNFGLKAQQQALTYAEQEIARAKAGHLPTLDIVGSYADSRANGGTSEELAGYNRRFQTGVLGLQLQIPLYQGGAITSREREAHANRQKAQDDLEAARRDVGLQARQSFLNVSSAVAQVKAYEQALNSSQSQLDSTNLGYEVGVRTSVDVLNAQQQYYSAKRDLLQARYQWMLSVIRLKAAAGVLSEEDIADTSKLLQGS